MFFPRVACTGRLLVILGAGITCAQIPRTWDDAAVAALELPLVNSLDEVVASWEAYPAGVLPREGASRRHPPQVPDLIGVKDRHYLDHTGLERHRSIGDLMRYAALNQGILFLARYGDFGPGGFPRTGRAGGGGSAAADEEPPVGYHKWLSPPATD
jgi:hypothetical protein